MLWVHHVSSSLGLANPFNLSALSFDLRRRPPTFAAVVPLSLATIPRPSPPSPDPHHHPPTLTAAFQPNRISPTINDAALREVVETISRRTESLLEIVNFNVEGQQYVAPERKDRHRQEKVKEMLGDIVDEYHKASVQKQKSEGYIKLERGFATISLPGIDVPFHSR
ncbi:hypothetical protein M407DRAFT_26132 [Tulasnella calospora MUT 4182]|uniref:Uncharacterized protein n=1 Tax=Tulasnella calospora MUT 4182 TaxID=1051891 RepID=A0A0C3QER5_9AGAM|nr:hypothetical protein M407DRAFT_26132 [Tulasnella calospora MUT 4182]